MVYTYEDLLRPNQRGYAPYGDLYYEPVKRLPDTVSSLVKITDTILTNLEASRKRCVDEFVIGKTFARKKKGHDFDPKNFTTWRLADGVNGRWRSKYEPEGFDGLIVLGVFTRESLPNKSLLIDGEGPLYNHQDYALAVEQQLIHYFAYDKIDGRLGNTSLSTGNVERKGAKAYVIYMAFKIEREE